jgi:hypothetical protein
MYVHLSVGHNNSTFQITDTLECRYNQSVDYDVSVICDHQQASVNSKMHPHSCRNASIAISLVMYKFVCRIAIFKYTEILKLN